MANVDSPYGLRAVDHLSGGQIRTRKYQVLASDGTALYMGSPVVLDDTGSARGIPNVIHATAGDTNYITGVCAGFEVSDGANTPNLNIVYRPASTRMFIYVWDDPYLLFSIQDDGGATPTADSMIGCNANFAGTSGSTVTGQSTAEIDMTTPANNASFQLFVHRLYDVENNDIGVNAEWLVSINLHTYRSTGDGDGSLGQAA